MDFNLGPNVELVAESAKAFAEKFIRPNVMDWDESQYFPKELLKQAGEFGFMGVLVPESLGGSGLGYHEYVSIIEEISKVIHQLDCLLLLIIHYVQITFFFLEPIVKKISGFLS